MRALTRKHSPNSARKRIFDGVGEAKLIALACSPPPKGRKRWTLTLLETAVVQLNIVDRASDNTIGRTLKKTLSSLTYRSNGSSHRRPTPPSVASMEDVLEVYQRRHDSEIDPSSAWTRRRSNSSGKRVSQSRHSQASPPATTTSMSAMVPPICLCCSPHWRDGGMSK